MIRLTRLWLLTVFFLLLIPAAAEAAPKRAGVPKFEGQQEALVRKKVMQVLKANGYVLVKSREIETALANAGALLDSDDGFARIAKELALSVIVTGEIGKKKAKITVHDGRDGSVLGEAVFAAANPRKLADEVGRSFGKKLGADVDKGRVPQNAKKPSKAPVAEAPEDNEDAPDAAEASAPAPEPEPRSKKSRSEPEAVASAEGVSEEAPPPKKKKKRKKVKTEEEGEGEGDDDGGGPGVIPANYDLAAGFAGINRSFGYRESLAGLRPYNLPAGPAVAANFVLYPLGMFMEGPLTNLGVDIRIEQAFFISSSLQEDATFTMCDDDMATAVGVCTFNTNVHEYAGGLRYRIPFGAGQQVYFSGTGGEHAFLFKTTDPAKAPRANLDIPDTIYRFVRPGVGARFELGGKFSISVAAGYRLIINGGGTHVGQYFPHRSIGGVDANLMVGYMVLPEWGLEVRGGLDYRRYFYSMNSQCVAGGACDRYVAGGAVDQYLTFGVMAAFRFGGSESAESADEAPAPKKRKRRPKAADEEAPSADE